jgi:MYXO-CTERM domain-containing protein
MKKVLVIMAVALVLAWSGSAMAVLKVVSINVSTNTTTNTLVAADVAGVVPVTNWNNVGSDTTGTPYAGTIIDKDGNATTLGYQSSGRVPNSVELVVGSDANVTMMSGMGIRSIYGDSGNHYAQMEMTNVWASLGGATTYDVYLYYGMGYNQSHLIGQFHGGYGNMLASSGEYTDATTDYPSATIVQSVAYGTMGGSSATPSLGNDPAYDTSVGFVISTTLGGGNYAKFTGLTLDTLVLTPVENAATYGWNGCVVLGIQLVANLPDPPVPIAEPAGLGLLGVALLALKRRRS